jgi:DNA adenine methylase
MQNEFFLPKRTTIASYPGGKSDRKKHLPLYLSVPKKISYLIEPFSGLANFFLVISPRISRVWLNDKDFEVYSILRCMIDLSLLKQLIEYVQSIEPVERDDYYDWKGKQGLNTLECAVRRLVILNCSPNGAGGGYSFEKAHRKWYQNKPYIWNEIHKIFTQKKVKLTNLDYQEVLDSLSQSNTPSEAFLYLDPPYYDVAQKGHLYGKELNIIDLSILRKYLSSITFQWILSNRDSPQVREFFSNFHLLGYNTYNDMNNTPNKNPELLISNKPLVDL